MVPVTLRHSAQYTYRLQYHTDPTLSIWKNCTVHYRQQMQILTKQLEVYVLNNLQSYVGFCYFISVLVLSVGDSFL